MRHFTTDGAKPAGGARGATPEGSAGLVGVCCLVSRAPLHASDFRARGGSAPRPPYARERTHGRMAGCCRGRAGEVRSHGTDQIRQVPRSPHEAGIPAAHVSCRKSAGLCGRTARLGILYPDLACASISRSHQLGGKKPNGIVRTPAVPCRCDGAWHGHVAPTRETNGDVPVAPSGGDGDESGERTGARPTRGAPNVGALLFRRSRTPG